MCPRNWTLDSNCCIQHKPTGRFPLGYLDFRLFRLSRPFERCVRYSSSVFTGAGKPVSNDRGNHFRHDNPHAGALVIDRAVGLVDAWSTCATSPCDASGQRHSPFALVNRGGKRLLIPNVIRKTRHSSVYCPDWTIDAGRFVCNPVKAG